MTDAPADALDVPLDYDPYHRACPSRGLLKSLGGLWTVLVVGALADAPEPLRFGELSAVVEGVSTKMLTQTLRDLERDGLVVREQYAEIPPRVTYALTPLGRGLAGALRPVETWTTSHMDEVVAARERYDAGR